MGRQQAEKDEADCDALADAASNGCGGTPLAPPRPIRPSSSGGPKPQTLSKLGWVAHVRCCLCDELGQGHSQPPHWGGLPPPPLLANLPPEGSPLLRPSVVRVWVRVCAHKHAGEGRVRGQCIPEVVGRQDLQLTDFDPKIARFGGTLVPGGKGDACKGHLLGYTTPS